MTSRDVRPASGELWGCRGDDGQGYAYVVMTMRRLDEAYSVWDVMMVHTTLSSSWGYKTPTGARFTLAIDPAINGIERISRVSA